MGLKETLKAAIENATRPQEVYSVPAHVIENTFTPEPLLFRNLPELNHTILAFMGMQDRAKGAQAMQENPRLGKIYLTEPSRSIPRSALGFKDDEERVPSSPAIMYTKYDISRVRTGFAVMLRDHIKNGERYAQDRAGCIKLAIGGYFDTKGRFNFEKIMLPKNYLSPQSRNQRLTDVPINENSIRGVLYYARLCTEQMFDRKTFSPDANFAISVDEFDKAPAVDIRSAPASDHVPLDNGPRSLSR